MNSTDLTAAEIREAVFTQLGHAERIKRRKYQQQNFLVWFVRIGAVAAWLGIWQFTSYSGLVDVLFVSSPSAIFLFLSEEIGKGALWLNLWVTLRETVLAFLIASVLGVSFGLLRINFNFLARVTDPFVTVLNALPRVAMAPLFIIWFGVGETSKVALAVSLVFFIMMINAESGAKGIEQEYFTVMRAVGASRYQMFRMVFLPGSVAAVFGGLRLAVVYSLTGVVFGEMLAARAGLGQQLQYYASTFRTDGVFGILLILGIVAMTMNVFVVLIERRLLRWRDPN